MNKRHVKPKCFEDFRIVEVHEPDKNWMRFYDIERKTIWINTAAGKECGVVKLEPKKL